ncbi:PQQ-like beta-propeller repeat protein [Cellulomonas sp. RIT-PI-Y]|uniref:PQQ-like beta-propeller repeat protein n=1 Tax=Cellulomonas sp. RIT-PI-Y TaxID=3035297 RepID=UPI0021DB3CDE|nr:PQQ-like beta-propeller repeat protein [Cellulomonas sp. RIT-PI-Y]
MSRGRREEMDEVELIEVDGPDSAAVPAPTVPWVRVPLPWKPVARRWWPLPVVLAAALVLADLGTGSRQERDVQHAQTVPGVARPIGPDVHVSELSAAEQWSWYGDPVAGLLVQSSWDESGAPEVSAVDPESGDQLWRTRLDSADPASAYSASSACWEESGLIACWSSVGVFDDDGAVQVTRSRLVRLDPADGELLSDDPLPEDTSLLGDGAIRVAATDRDGTVAVSATEPDGTALWAVELPDQDGSAGFLSLSLRFEDDLVLLGSPGGAWALDRRDGRTLAAGAAVWESRQGRLLVSGDGTVQVATRGGGQVDLGEGDPVLLGTDDGSVPQAEFVADRGGDRLHAVDARTGARMWTSEEVFSGGIGLVLVAGLLIGPAPDGLLALDARTGAVRWRDDVAVQDTWSGLPVTDGRHVLLVGQEDDGPALVALDLHSGVRTWTAPLPSDALGLAVVDHRLLLYRDSGTSELS